MTDKQGLIWDNSDPHASCREREHSLSVTLSVVAAERDRYRDRCIAAARLGYMAGHDDTVESCYGDPDEVAKDLCLELDEDGGTE